MAKAKHDFPQETIEFYEKLVDGVPAAELKGATVPYTSHKGHMYSCINKKGLLELRLPPDEIEKFIKKYKTTLATAYGIVRKEYVFVPAELLKKTKELLPYFKMSFEYVDSLKAKPTTKKK